METDENRAVASTSSVLPFRWMPFDPAKGWRQKRPPLRKDVLVLLAARITDQGDYPQAVAVGYRKDSGGDKSLPFFVVPGIGGDVIAWCDCLPTDYKAPERFPKRAMRGQNASDQATAKGKL